LLLYSIVSPNEDRTTVQAVSRRPLEAGSGSNPEQPTWDLLRTDWQWHGVFSEYFAFPLSVSFHQCSIFMFYLSVKYTI